MKKKVNKLSTKNILIEKLLHPQWEKIQTLQIIPCQKRKSKDKQHIFPFVNSSIKFMLQN